jgi:TRAP transporter TAXI family solute receptor
VVRADAPYRAIGDLVGKRIAFGAKGSGLVILARYVLDGLGLDRDSDFDAVFLDLAGDGPEMVMSGEAAALWGAGVGWPGFKAVTGGPAGGRFIVPDVSEIARIQAKHPFLKMLTVPAGTYPGQTTPIVSVGSWSFVLARPGLAEDTAYKIARALHKGEAAIGARLEQARETTAANTVNAAPRRELIHPGVQQYLKEAGLLH